MLKLSSNYTEKGLTTLGPLGYPCSDEEARNLEAQLNTGEYSSFQLEKASKLEGLFESERAELSTLTDDSVDKEGDVVPPDSLDWAQFEKHGSPTCFQHNYNIPPVGRSLWFKRVGNAFKGKTHYFEKPEEHPKDSPWFSDSIWYLVKSGVLKGKSIGGAVKWRQPIKEDIEKNVHWDGAKRIAEKAVVYEYSVCTVAMNNNAIVEVLNKGLIDLPDDILEKHFSEIMDDIKKVQAELPVITKFKTAEDYQQERKALIDNHVAKFTKKLPETIDNHIRRLLGKVV